MVGRQPSESDADLVPPGITLRCFDRFKTALCVCVSADIEGADTQGNSQSCQSSADPVVGRQLSKSDADQNPPESSWHRPALLCQVESCPVCVQTLKVRTNKAAVNHVKAALIQQWKAAIKSHADLNPPTSS